MDFIKQARKQVKIGCSSTGCASTDPAKEEAFYAHVLGWNLLIFRITHSKKIMGLFLIL